MNLALIILYATFRIFFEKDRNFRIRRWYLLGVLTLPVLVPFLPTGTRSALGNMLPISFHLNEFTITANGIRPVETSTLSPLFIAGVFYLSILGLGIAKLVLQLGKILRQARRSERVFYHGVPLRSSSSLHATSFFGFIFMDPSKTRDEAFDHILDHEVTHKREWHSLDRIMTELFVLVNWFNPAAWLLRNSVIGNLEYLADEAVLRRGTDPVKYQLSILNQYIGSASLSNSFNRQIKKRINMLNRNYRMGSIWKLTIFIPLTLLIIMIVSCTEKVDSPEPSSGQKISEASIESPSGDTKEKVFSEVETMPSFNGGDGAVEFRKYIGKNLKYPETAFKQGISGKVFIQFIVNSKGQVVNAKVTRGVSPELDNEALRVINSSPDWTPGKQGGKEVNVMYTFPINFALN